MKRSSPTLAVVLAVSFLVSLPACARRPLGFAAARPPVAEIIPKQLTIHGDTRIDNYYWLNQRDNPKVIQYLEAENAYTKAVMKPTEALQDKLYKELVGRIKQTDLSVPYRSRGYYYYTRYEQGSEYPVYCRKKGSLDANEEVLLNVPEMARGREFFSAAGLSVSPDNRLLSYGVDTVSRRMYSIHFKDLATGQTLPDEIANTTGDAVWANDNKTIFYSLKDEVTLRPFKILRHVLGTPAAKDKLVFHEADDAFDVGVYKSRSKAYILISSSSTVSNECRCLEADKPDGEFRILQARQRDLEYQADHFRDKFYILTNSGGAKNFQLMTAPVAKPARENWAPLIPARDDVLLEGFEMFNDYLVVQERKGGLARLRIIPWDKGTKQHQLDFGEATYSAGLGANPEPDTGWLRYDYSSLTTPNSTFDYNMATREKKLLKRQEVLGGFRPENYQAERLIATARDGTRVPISLVYRKGLVRNGRNPCLLYGYGSYGASTDADFYCEVLSLLDRGFIYAIAHVRGGQEMGRWWYDDGKLLKKKNTFTDFIDCAEYLVAQRFTDPGLLFAEGASAGGLLMGAVANMRPDLFRGILAEVPFVDAVTTMLDHSIPLSAAEFDEWGNPEIKKYYDYMLSYSPYDRVEAKAYPALFVSTGVHDSQVQYFEPAKWVAKLRAMKTDDHPLVFLINMDAGHGGQSGRFRALKETAMEYAFILTLVGDRAVGTPKGATTWHTGLHGATRDYKGAGRFSTVFHRLSRPALGAP
jgi:oligopeptidase B